MKKNIINISLVFAFIFGMFFIGAGDVEASACSCYYRVQQSGTANDLDTTTRYYYKLDLDTNKADFDRIIYTVPINDGTTGLNSKPYYATANRGTPFNVNSKYITSKNCSKKACKTAKINIAFKNGGYAWQTLLACSDKCSLDGAPCTPCTEREQSEWNAGAPLVVSTKEEYENINVNEENGDNNGYTSDTPTTSVDLNTVKKWGEKNSLSTLYKKNSLNACNVIDGDLKDKINEVLTLICVVSIILLIIMSMIEFVKAVTGANDDLIKTAFKHTIIRIVCVVILFLLPILVSSVIDLVNKANGPQTDANGNYIIGEDGNPLCGVGE